MAVFATFDAHGLPTAFYPEDVFPPSGGERNAAVPAGAVEISDADHQALIAAPGAAAWDGKAVVAYAPPPAPPAVRKATTYALLSAFTDAQRATYPGLIKAWDQRMFSARDTPWPEGNEKIARIAAALGTTPAAWFDAALKPAAG